MGHGCSAEGYRDRWPPTTPTITYPQVLAMAITAAKEPAYNSSWEDPKNGLWGKQTEPILVPRGDNNMPLYDTIYSVLVAEARPRPEWAKKQWVDRSWG
eukprot:5555016-Karenia_brevis.AAC.1